MTTVLISPDKFKGSLTAYQVCQAIEVGIHRYNPDVVCILHPLADGGEGTLDALDNSLQLKSVNLTVNDPLFRPIQAEYKLQDQSAYIEMSRASGLELLSHQERNCMLTTSFGTGELISDAIAKGASKIYLFIGGSATNDAGIGLLSALGYNFLNENGEEINPTGAGLEDIVQIDDSQLKFERERITVTVVCDVTNPLFGPHGAAYIYGPQKGASPEDIRKLDLGLRNFNAVVKSKYGKDLSSIAGGGAAGGIGAGAVGLLNAELQPGIESVMEISNYKSHLKDVDLVVTGEGKMDKQTVQGKVIEGVFNSATEKGIPMSIVCGIAEDLDTIRLKINSPIYQLKTDGLSLDYAIANAKELVELRAFEAIKDFTEKRHEY